jgi:hypothetical protein
MALTYARPISRLRAGSPSATDFSRWCETQPDLSQPAFSRLRSGFSLIRIALKCYLQSSILRQL